MLSFESGTPIAIVRGGKDKNKILCLVDPNEKKDNLRIESKAIDDLDEELLRRLIKKISKNDARILRNAIRDGEQPEDERLAFVYLELIKDNKERTMTNYKIFDDGALQPLPDFEKTERSYIAGPTGSGKSCYCRKYMEQFIKVFPKKKIFLFSDVKEDPEIDTLKNVVRFALTDDLVGEEINPELFKNSICLFDDIDSLQNPKLLKRVQALRDSLIVRGRHENIHVIATSHLMTNYKDTRIILNNSNSLTFFPKAGAVDGITYMLRKYVGLSKKQIQDILALPSRWVTVYKNYPNYVLYEKGAYIL